MQKCHPGIGIIIRHSAIFSGRNNIYVPNKNKKYICYICKLNFPQKNVKKKMNVSETNGSHGTQQQIIWLNKLWTRQDIDMLFNNLTVYTLTPEHTDAPQWSQPQALTASKLTWSNKIRLFANDTMILHYLLLFVIMLYNFISH